MTGKYTMKLNDFNRKNVAQKALKENFDVNFNVSKLDKVQTKKMLSKVIGLINEAKTKKDYYNINNPSYMKLVFMSQALTEHYRNFKPTRIIVENEEVNKSEVILAVQDMINNLQKMLENVNDMLVKELPALTDSIESEIGVNESSAYNQAATTALTTLNQTLGQSKQQLQDALNQMTGVGSTEAFGAGGGAELPPPDMGGGEEGELPPPDMGGGEEGGEALPEPEESPEPEERPSGRVGREKR